MAASIIIPPLLFQKIMYWINKSSNEVSGLGTLEQHGDLFVVTSAILVPQENGSAHSDIEAADVARASYQLRDRGPIRWWWHSHVNMGVFWSGTDKDTMKTLAGEGWIAATVFNKREEIRSAICVGAPTMILADEIPTFVQHPVTTEELLDWEDEYTTNVTEAKGTSLPLEVWKARRPVKMPWDLDDEADLDSDEIDMGKMRAAVGGDDA